MIGSGSSTWPGSEVEDDIPARSAWPCASERLSCKSSPEVIDGSPLPPKLPAIGRRRQPRALGTEVMLYGGPDNLDTLLVSGLPGKARLQPGRWGIWRFQ
jgi:hypothetical protein